tara:strand:- start:225213 stop:229085 length:3873 start_codon:yes stop_codon:yes gene_type:complete
MFGYVHHRFLCIATASVFASVLQPMLQAQVQISGSTTHYRSIEGHRNFGSEKFDLLGMGTDPDDKVDFMVTKSNSNEECPSTDSLHVYSFDTTINDWVSDGSIDHIGGVYIDRVDIHKDAIIIGGNFDPSPVPGATIYRRGFGGVWKQEASLLPADNVIGDRFGCSVSIYGDLAVVGARQEGPNPHSFHDGPGSVYIYQFNGMAWTMVDKITADTPVDGEDFGQQVSVHDSPTGPVIIVAAPDRNTTPSSIGSAGSVYSFKIVDGSWTQIDRVEASTAPQNFGGEFGLRIDHDETTLGITDNRDIYVYTIDADGSMTLGTSLLGTEFLGEVAVAQGSVLVGDPQGGLPSPNSLPNISKLRASGHVTDYTIPFGLSIDGGYGKSLAYNGNYFLTGLPTLNYAGNQAGGIWRQDEPHNAQTSSLFLVGQASPNAQFGDSIASTDQWTAIGSPNSINDCITGATGSVRMLSLGIDDWIQYKNIYPPIGITGAGFGSAIAIQGNQMAVTMPGYAIPGLQGVYGAVFVYEYAFPQWTLVQTIEGTQQDDAFGASIALAGSTLAIGMPDGPSGGEVKIMRRDAAGLFQNELTSGRGDLTQDAHFGHGVSLYQNQLLISAPDDATGTGSVFAMEYDSVTGTWSTQTPLTLPTLVSGSRFGYAVTQSQSHAIIGIPATGIEPGRLAIYPRTQQGFGQPTIITEPPGITQEGFGAYIAAKDNKLMVGYDDPSASIAHVMINGANTYQHLQTISAPSGDAGARFGSAMAIGAETLFIGSSNQTLDIIAGAGAVDLYELEIRYTVPECDMDMNSDYVQWIQDDAPNQSELFAYSVEVDEGYAIVGTPYEDYSLTFDGTTINGDNAGKATIFERTGLRKWTPVAFFRGGNFDAPFGVSHTDWLGWSVDIEQSTAIAGGIQGRLDNSPIASGSIRIYERGSTGWTEFGEIFPPNISVPGNDPVREFGAAVDLDSSANFIAVGASNSAIGAVGTGAGFVLERSGNEWVSTDALTPPTVLFGDHIGVSAAVEEGWAAFGASDDDTNGSSSGAVHIYKRSGLGNWVFHSTVYSPNPHASARFGNALEISRSDLGLTMVVGSLFEQEGTTNSVGAGHIFVLDELNDQWNSTQRLLPEFLTTSALYGKDVSIDHNTIAVGAPSLRDSDVGPSVWTGGVEMYNLDQLSGQFVRRTTIRPEQNQWGSPNGWGNAIGLSGGTVFLGTSLADGDPYNFANNNLNYGAVTAHDIICVPDCPADLNGDGVLNFFDVSAFINAFSLQDPGADYNGDGMLNFFDVSAFLVDFSAGC